MDVLIDELARLSGLLAREVESKTAKETPAGKQGDRVELESFARKLLTFRRQRAKAFGADLLGEPGWDMLLYLFSEYFSENDVFVKAVCLTSGVPFTTGLRWLGVLESAGLLARIDDPRDKRRQCVKLTPIGYRKMHKCMTHALELMRYDAPIRR